MRELTQLLLDEGHRRIAILGRIASASYHLRSEGYQRALRGAGIEPDPALEIEVDSWTAEAGVNAIRSHLTRHELPHAIICCTDSLAMGVLSAQWGDGYRVPDDVSIVGYDDVPEAAALVPPLTTVHFDRAAMAEAALDLLARRIADPTRLTDVHHPRSTFRPGLNLLGPHGPVTHPHDPIYERRPCTVAVWRGDGTHSPAGFMLR